MRNPGLIILGIAALAWGVLAIVLGPASLRLSPGAGATAAVSPSCLPGTLDHTARLPGTDLDVSPAPETATANPHTQVSFLGMAAAEIHGVSVVGERSGHHPGRLRAYSQGDGASFAPDSPFEKGERVAVHAVIGSGGAARQVGFRFRVDTPFSTERVPQVPNPAEAPAVYTRFYTL